MKKYLAELPGTFVLVFMGTGSAVVAGKEIGVLGIALAFGLSVLRKNSKQKSSSVNRMLAMLLYGGLLSIRFCVLMAF